MSRFGASGAGNRTGRRTMTRGGLGSTARNDEWTTARRTRSARLDEPPISAIWEAIRTQQCCWCADPRTFKSLSGHLERGHGFVLNELRDLLMVPRNTPFAGVALREGRRVRAKARYEADPTVLRSAPPAKVHRLGAFGKAQQKAKSARAHELHPPREQVCEECGAVFVYSKASRKSCGKTACKFAVKSRALTGKPKTITNPRTKFKGRTLKPCAVCGVPVYQRKTCSRECFVAGQRATAEARDRSARTCEVAGCGSPHKAKGLCANHYQNRRRA